MENKITLAGTQKEVNPNSIYMVDFTKMQSVNDMVLILASMAIAFPGNHPNIEQLKPFLNLDNPIDREQPQQPKQSDLKLPKLKTLNK
jgi:hypothetical protein